MAYLTREAYEARFGAQELEQVIDTIDGDDSTFDAAVADAESIVNGYLAAVPGRVFVVPLAIAIPSRIVEITADLTRYELHVKKVTFEIKRRRDQAIAFLEGLVAGTMAIPELQPDGGNPQPIVSQVEVFAEDRVFTACNLRGYVGP